ncbi:diguanylate cyclase [Marinobacterium nitratireducens]|uniref:Diguanylate cyclase n=1 Tax=Marinobacterium nitratireducens TaxID=518897 RepID=A0A917ZES6_9GAMM|nr:sensor domain-containing diguanylate cyclase [Marinobacterium nitratireducens]GGO81496.1 diguanylate cyclase [Marinobacterium nitratireducens]
MHSTYCHSSAEAADFTLNQLLDLISEGSWDWDGHTGKVRRSPGWYRMLGYQPGAFREDVFTWENLIHPDDYSAVMQHIDAFIKGERPDYRIEYRCRRATGDFIWILDRARIVEHDPDGRAARIIGVHLDIQREKQLQQELEQKVQLLQRGKVRLEQLVNEKTLELESRNEELHRRIAEIEYYSNTDTLTGIANRKRFEEALTNEISRARRYQHALSLVMFDLDFFKQINDSRGHSAGDRVLREMAGLVRANLRDIDIFARWGGEEFTLVLPDLELENAFRVAEKLRQLIQDATFGDGIKITASFGVTEFDEDEIDEILRRADIALYQAKQRGRNRVEQKTKSGLAVQS